MTPINEIIARAICRETCAFMGEPPCFKIGDGLSPNCDEPGCSAHAKAVIKALDEAGFAIVPKEPTEAMKLVGGNTVYMSYGADDAADVYRAMIAACQGKKHDRD